MESDDSGSPRTLPADVIEIEGLAVRTIIGIFDDERENRQEIRIDLRLETDNRRAARTDRIEDALDYKSVTKRVLAFVGDTRFFLVETMAEQIADLLLAEFPTPRVTVRVSKPGALRYANNVSITITRARG